jgi:hypothetical protein
MNRSLSRRTLLRGAGITMCLPWLESFPAFGAESSSGAAAKPPTRFAALFFPNGVEVSQWGASGEGDNLQFKRILEPLEPVKRKVVIPSGLWHERLAQRPAHNGKTSGFLTGMENYKLEGDLLKVGISIDQAIAEKVGQGTALPSFNLGVKPDDTTKREDLPIYRSYISWATPSRPAAKEVDPRFAYDQLFSEQGRRRRNMSILDVVAEEAKDLQKQVSKNDQQRLDQFFTSVRDVEKLIDQSEKASVDGWKPSTPAQVMARPTVVPEERQEHTRLMLDLMTLALQMNKTRVATFMFDNGGCAGNFSFLPGVTEEWHASSHHNHRPEMMRQQEAICRWHVEQLVYLLQKMDSIQEGEGTLLDHSMVLMGSELKDGNNHSSQNLPLILAGSGSGTIRTGRVIEYPDDSQLAGLFLAIAERMGAPLGSFADATKPICGLT